MMFFFDLDGTLLNSTRVWQDIDVEFLGRRGISPVPADYTWYVTHHSAPEAARYTQERYCPDMTAQEIMDTWSAMAKYAYGHTLPLKAGAKEFLEQCAGAGVRMGILTSCFPELCQAALERHGLTEYFEIVLTTMETGLEKRDGALYRMAAQQCGVEPTACVLFEDNPDYCAAAKGEGFSIVGIQDQMFAAKQEALKALCASGHYREDFVGLRPQDI